MIFFGFFSTVFLFLFFNKFKNWKFFKKIPVILSAGVCLILILQIFKIDYLTYYKSAEVLSYMIAPATIALAFPMYKNSKLLFENKRALYPAVIIATLVAAITTYFLAKFLGAEFEVVMSLLPKSTTMPSFIQPSQNTPTSRATPHCLPV